MTTRVRALLIDDEPLARQRLRDMLEDYPQIEVIGEAGGGTTAVAKITSLLPDMVFLDVQMPELDGFEVLRALDPATIPLVVFVTAFDAHAIRAFDVSAVDYLLKPVMPDRFRAAVDRVLQRLEGGAGSGHAKALLRDLPRTTRSDGRVPVPTDDGVLLLPITDIQWAEVAGDYIRLHTGVREYLMRETMADFETRLPADTFMRIHRSTLVNLSLVREVKPHAKGDFLLVLQNGTKLRSGKTYRERVQKLLQ